MDGKHIMLSAKEILSAPDIGDLRKVEVPEWGGHVFVKIMSGAERDYWEVLSTHQMREMKTINLRATLCVMTVCDEKGKRLFKDEEVKPLGDKSAIVLDRIFDIASRLNKLTNDDLKELEKNLVAA